MNKRRKELLRVLMLAEQGKLSAADLIDETNEPISVRLNLYGDGQHRKDDGTIYTEQELERERRRGHLHVTLNLS